MVCVLVESIKHWNCRLNPLESAVKTIALIAAYLILMICASSTATAQIALISCAEAKALLEQPNAAERPIVIDTRGGYKDYFRGHLPFAHHLNFDTLRGTDAGIPVQYLPDDLTRALLIRAGVDRHRTHILYATGQELPNDEILSATMVAYVLEKFGIRDIRLLDGGLAEWQRLGFPTTQEYFGNSPGALPDDMNEAIAIDLEGLMAIKDRPDVLLVDARPHNEFVGNDDIWLRKGHIPGAMSFHWARLTEPNNTHKFIAPKDALEKLQQAGVTRDKEIIVYCGTSREGSLLRFYLSHVAGYPKVRLYEGSWKEYASLKNYPVETGDGR